MSPPQRPGSERPVVIPAGHAHLPGDLALPPGARGLVLFAHGSGSSRLSPRNRAVAAALRRVGVGTLLLDLLTAEEDRAPEVRFDIELLARRLLEARAFWLEQAEAEGLLVGYFGASTGAAAALLAAAREPAGVASVVSRGGRPDLALDELPSVKAATLLIVGGRDEAVLGLNRRALAVLQCPKELAVVPRAGHLFEEPGALEQVQALASDWFLRHFPGD
jgi:putative phosphoribosyl transferase